LGRLVGNRETTGNRLETALLTAGAWNTIWHDLDVADFHGGLLPPSYDMAIEDCSAADSCSWEYADHVLSTLGSPPLAFTVYPRIDIIEQVDVAVELFADNFHEFNVLPAEVNRSEYSTRLHIDGSGDTDADGFQI